MAFYGAKYLVLGDGTLLKAPVADGAPGEVVATDGAGQGEFVAVEAAGAAAAAIATHVGQSDPHTQYQRESEKGAANGYASLDGSSQIPAAQIPAIAITEHLGEVANQSALLALSGQKGDWAIRLDTGTVWVITGSDPTQLASWTELEYPAAPVSSVAGRTGAVTLTSSDLTDTTSAGRALLDDADAAAQRTTLGLGAAAVAGVDDSTVEINAGNIRVKDGGITYAKAQNISATSRLLGRKTAGAGVIEECTLSEVLDFIASAAQGDLLYRGASAWARLPAGTSGHYLQTQGAGANPQWAAVSGGGTVPVHVADGRLTTESGVSISTSDRASQSTIYYTPHIGNQIALYSGSAWSLHTFTERSLALSGLTSGKNYDVFLYDNSGTLTLELSAAWTNDTTRADALTTQDGVLVKSGATTRRYLGTIRTTGTTTTEDSLTKRFVWNVVNQVHRRLLKSMGSSSHTYGSATVRQYNADATAQIEFVVGRQNGDQCFLHPAALISASASGTLGRLGAGENTTTAISYSSLLWEYTTRVNISIWSAFTPRVGYSYVALVEQNQSGSNLITYDFGTMSAVLVC